MKRAIVACAILACLALGVGGAVTAHPAATAGADTPYHGPYGGGKLSLPPRGNWWVGGGPVDPRPLPGPRLPGLLPVFGTDIQLGPGEETVIVANPLNPLNFQAGANITSHFATNDGGVTWSTIQLNGGGDPAAAYDGSGNAYFAELHDFGCPANVWVYKSTDGGFTFGGPVTTLTDPSPNDHFTDKEWLAADSNPGSPFFGRVYASATSFHVLPNCNLSSYVDNRMVVSVSTDHGATFSPEITFSDASHNQDQFSNPAIASNGTVYYGYQYQNCTTSCTGVPAYNLTTHSTTGGLSWSPSITITGQPISYTGASVAGYQYLLASSPTTAFRHNDQAIIGVAPNNANQLYALWSDGRWESTFTYQGVVGWHADIAFSRSLDGGATWSTPRRVNDDAQGNGKDQFFPWMVVGSDGTIHASWMDRRDDPNGYMYREYYSQSTDGGLTWSANQPVADVGSTPGGFIGDYTGLAVNSNNTLVLPIWTDMRSGQRVYTDRGILPPAPTATTTGTATETATAMPTNTSTPPPTVTTAPPTATSVPPTATRVPPSATSVPPSVTAVLPSRTPPGATATASPPSATATPCSITFSDVHPGDYFAPAVAYLACRGIISGYADDTFRPFNPTTRGQMVKIVVRGFGLALVTPPGGAYTFHDVDPANPFFAYVETAASHHIVSGYTCGTVPAGACDPQQRPYFLPNAYVTRGQLTKIVVGAAGWVLLTPPTPTFADVSTGNPFYAYIETAAQRGIISGYNCGGSGEPCNGGHPLYFRPGNNATRGQIAKIVYNALLSGPAQPTR